MQAQTMKHLHAAAVKGLCSRKKRLTPAYELYCTLCDAKNPVFDLDLTRRRNEGAMKHYAADQINIKTLLKTH